MNIKQLESVISSEKVNKHLIYQKVKGFHFNSIPFLSHFNSLQIRTYFNQVEMEKKSLFCNGYALKTGLHVGHKFLRLSKNNFWHPLMAQYFLGIRDGICLLDPVQTRKCILRAFYVIALVLKRKNSSNAKSNVMKITKQIKQKAGFGKGVPLQKSQNAISSKKSVGHILIVNTNPEFSQLCKNLSVLTLHKNNQNLGLNINTSCFSYVHYKWVGGTLTNWKQVSKSVLTYAKFAERCEKFLYRHDIKFPRYYKIKECFHGLIRKKQGQVYLAFNDKPDLVFLMNPNENRHIIAEANKMFIPVIALVESNTCLEGISYPIPANAYSAFFIYYCLKKILKLSSF